MYQVYIIKHSRVQNVLTHSIKKLISHFSFKLWVPHKYWHPCGQANVIAYILLIEPSVKIMPISKSQKQCPVGIKFL